ncbi:TonB-dependent receptor [Ichthyenterobacterium sp. W332]|uniref:TonB-dependent receptor n=1 Tax=Microcosmobacter mediterraneus TaxID=3075607 RepID=A0ABU2YNX3_9FLAO|nr:TonB-dependent receptor [Ichthyenterobacterium sp. W332]MDT0559532.1 TonB-dependent receptor [Ichthyenterobacterium sp. W332]
MRHLCIAMTILCFAYGNAQDCNYKLTGTIQDFHDGTPIAGATIYMKNLKTYTTTNIDGYFAIEDLCKGTLILEISHLACETKILEIDIKGDMVKLIKLEHHLEELNEVTVKTEENTETNTAQETIIKSKVINRYSSLSLGDVLKEVPGVSSINTGNTIVKPMINGLHSSRILILNNGVRQQDQEWGIEHAPNIDINSANQISVIKGSGALAYGGDALGGVIIINPSKFVKRDTLYGNTIVGGQSNGRGYHISTAINKDFISGWFAQFQGTYKRRGDFEAPDYNLTNTGLDSRGFSTRVGKKKFESGFELFYSFIDNTIGILGASHIGSVFDIERAINSGQPLLIEDFSYDINAPKQDITHHLAKANYYKRFQNFGKLSVQYDYQYNKRLEFDVRIGDRRNIPAVDLTLQTHTISADVNLDNNLERKINFGIMGRYQDNFANPDTGVRRLIPDYNKYDFGTYITTELKLNANLLIDAGLRYDFNRIDAKKFYQTSRWEERGYDNDFSDIIIEELPTQLLTNPVFNYHNISASIGGKYTVNEKNEIRFNYNLASRPPNVSELFSDGLHHSSARFEFGDLRFDTEIANRVSLSYAYNSPNFSLVTELFYNRITNFIYLRPFDFILTGRGPFPLWEYQQTNAEMLGVDLTAIYNISKSLEFQNKTAFIKGYDLEMDVPLIDIPSFNTINQLTYTNSNWYNFSASLRSEWVFEQNEFPDFNFEVLDQLNEEMILIDISTPPAAYHLLHFYTEAAFSVSENTTLNVALGINNLFDTSYRNYLNRLRFFADDLGRNITLQLELNY